MEQSNIKEIDTIVDKVDEYLYKLRTMEAVKVYEMIKDIHDLLNEIKRALVNTNIAEV